MSDIKLFNKWSLDDVEVTDIGLKKYISLRPIIIPHSHGRTASQRFKKAELNIVERFINKLMRKGRNTGKKIMVMNAVEAAFEMIYAKTGKNPVQVLVDAIQNVAPREETTRVTFGGIAQHQSVDIAPLRRVDLALRYLAQGINSTAFNNVKSFPEIIADELIAAANNDTKSIAIRKKQELERIALSAR